VNEPSAGEPKFTIEPVSNLGNLKSIADVLIRVTEAAAGELSEVTDSVPTVEPPMPELLFALP
jgi:hypothetical protein